MPQVSSEFMDQFGQWALMIGFFVVIILVMWLPQRKQKKQFNTMIASLKAGDNIRTIGGFLGKIVQVKEDIVIFECGPDKTKLAISNKAISAVENVDFENTVEKEKVK